MAVAQRIQTSLRLSMDTTLMLPKLLHLRNHNYAQSRVAAKTYRRENNMTACADSYAW